MEVILIREDNHGVIGVAKNYYNALKKLFREGWLDKNKEDDNLINWTVDEFNEAFEGNFFLERRYVEGT